MAVLKSADFRSRNILSTEKSVNKAQEIVKAEYVRIAHVWQRMSRGHGSAEQWNKNFSPYNDPTIYIWAFNNNSSALISQI